MHLPRKKTQVYHADLWEGEQTCTNDLQLSKQMQE